MSIQSLQGANMLRRCWCFGQVGLWIFGGMLKVDAVTAAILGLSVLLCTGVVTWKECLAESVAWDTLTWFAALIAMAGYLNKYGLISWFSQTVVKVCLFMHAVLFYNGLSLFLDLVCVDI
jgi:di/tricarboxylate transporter